MVCDEVVGILRVSARCIQERNTASHDTCRVQGGTEDSLFVRHDLHLHALAVKVVEAKVLSGSADIMYAPSQMFGGSLQLRPRLDLALQTILLNVFGDRGGYMELVGVWVGALCLLQLEDMPRTDFEVLLCCWFSSCTHVIRKIPARSLAERETSQAVAQGQYSDRDCAMIHKTRRDLQFIR